jgi:hypothetical protein
MMVTLVMMMFQVMTILTFFLPYNFFKWNNYYIIFSNCPHDGRASRISGGASWFLYLLVLLASCNFCLNSTPGLLLNANSAIFQLYHGENKLIFNEMMMTSALITVRG